MIIILLGPPGAGKGTQARLLEESNAFTALSTGQMLRQDVSEGSEFGNKVKEIMNAGELVPDDVVMKMIGKHIDSLDMNRGIILDGVPRTSGQAKMLDSLLSIRERQVDLVVEIVVDNDLLIDRITGRLMCEKCGAGYHEKYRRPLIEGVCDGCGSSKFTRRSDDTVGTIKARLKSYYAETAPLVDHYRTRDIVRAVDGTASVIEVMDQIRAVMEV